MPARSGLVAALALVFTAASATGASAHRREDYLQAARVAIEPDHVLITLSLTPGLMVADTLIASIDRDRDGVVSAGEQRDYAEQVVRALEVELDQRPLPFHLLSCNVADLAALRRGEGAVRLAIESTLPAISSGAHQLLFRNTHLADHSVYLANALVPESPRVTVTAQHRDREQTELAVEFTVHGDATKATLPWVLGGLVAGFAMLRSRPFSLP